MDPMGYQTCSPSSVSSAGTLDMKAKRRNIDILECNRECFSQFSFGFVFRDDSDDIMLLVLLIYDMIFLEYLDST